MASQSDNELPKQQQRVQDGHPRCKNCATFPRLNQQFLDPRSGKSVYLYRCDCGGRFLLKLGESDPT